VLDVRDAAPRITAVGTATVALPDMSDPHRCRRVLVHMPETPMKHTLIRLSYHLL
jgi:hypothetical protein